MWFVLKATETLNTKKGPFEEILPFSENSPLFLTISCCDVWLRLLGLIAHDLSGLIVWLNTG